MKEMICNDMRLKGNIFFLSHINHFIFLLKYIFLLSFIITTEEKLKYLINFKWEIKLVILGSGNQGIINDKFYLEPSEVEVNGISKDSCKKFCEMDLEENNVTLYFNAPVTSTEKMFAQLFNIKEIDLSNFDFSGVKDMIDMFINCTT